jgi:hypothetical protein
VPTKKAPHQAKARLENIVVGEGSLVDRAANEHVFLVKKNAEGAPAGGEAAKAEEPKPADGAAPVDPANAEQPKEQEQKADPMIAPDAKQALLDELGACLEELSALATTIQDTATQDGAGVPAPFAEMLRNAAARLSGAADQFAPVPAPEVKSDAPAAAADGGDAPASAPAGDTAAIERAMENVLQRYGVQPPAQKAAGAPAEPTLKSVADDISHVKSLVQGVLARSVIGSITKSNEGQGNAAPVEKSVPASSAPAAPKSVAWGSDFSETVLAEQAAKAAKKNSAG